MAAPPSARRQEQHRQRQTGEPVARRVRARDCAAEAGLVADPQRLRRAFVAGGIDGDDGQREVDGLLIVGGPVVPVDIEGGGGSVGLDRVGGKGEAGGQRARQQRQAVADPFERGRVVRRRGAEADGADVVAGHRRRRAAVLLRPVPARDRRLVEGGKRRGDAIGRLQRRVDDVDDRRGHGTDAGPRGQRSRRGDDRERDADPREATHPAPRYWRIQISVDLPAVLPPTDAV